MRKGQRRKNPKRYISAGFSQRPFGRPAAHTKPPKSLLIVTEGQNTEPLYLKVLAQHWTLHPHVTCIEPGGEGIPKNLVDKALKMKTERAKRKRTGKLAFNQTASFDEIWIVFDTEHAERHGHLHSGMAHADKYGIRTAHSTPCFEFWFCLHYELKAPAMEWCREAERLFEQVAKLKHGAYSKAAGASKGLIDCLVPKVMEAIRHAERLTNQQEEDDFPANPSTSVHTLVKSMWEAQPEELKKRFPLPS